MYVCITEIQTFGPLATWNDWQDWSVTLNPSIFHLKNILFSKINKETFGNNVNGFLISLFLLALPWTLDHEPPKQQQKITF